MATLRESIIAHLRAQPAIVGALPEGQNSVMVFGQVAPNDPFPVVAVRMGTVQGGDDILPFTFPTFFVAVMHKTAVLHRPDWYLIDRLLNQCREALHGASLPDAADDDIHVFETVFDGLRSQDLYDFASGADYRMDRFRSSAVLTISNHHP